jgi:hypothetical protein
MRRNEICRFSSRLIDMLHYGPRWHRKRVTRCPSNGFLLAIWRCDDTVSITLIAVVEERAGVLRYTCLDIAAQSLCLKANSGRQWFSVAVSIMVDGVWFILRD